MAAVIASVVPQQAPVGVSVELLRPDASSATPTTCELQPCIADLGRHFEAHAEPGRLSLARCLRHTRLFRLSAADGCEDSNPVHLAALELLRQTAAISEFAVTAHVRTLLQRFAARVE